MFLLKSQFKLSFLSTPQKSITPESSMVVHVQVLVHKSLTSSPCQVCSFTLSYIYTPLDKNIRPPSKMKKKILQFLNHENQIYER